MLSPFEHIFEITEKENRLFIRNSMFVPVIVIPCYIEIKAGQCEGNYQYNRPNIHFGKGPRISGPLIGTLTCRINKIENFRLISIGHVAYNAVVSIELYHVVYYHLSNWESQIHT